MTLNLSCVRVLFSTLLLISTSTAHANVLDDVWGIVVDPLKIGSGAEDVLSSVREAQILLTGLHDLQEETDQDIRFYLQDIDKKINRVEEVGQALINQTLAGLTELETKITKDLHDVIKAAKCEAIDAADDVFNKALRDVLPSWLEGNYRYVQLPFGTESSWIFWTKPKTVKIDMSLGPSAQVQFETIETAVLENLAQYADANSSTARLVGAYADLARLARRFQCLHTGDHFNDYFVRKYAKYNAEVYPWVKMTKFGGLINAETN